MHRLHLWAGAAIGVLAVLALGWVVLAPGWAVHAIREAAEAELGRKLEVAGGAHLELAPRLAIRLDGVSLANPAAADGAFVIATSVRIPITVLQLLTRRMENSEAALISPAIGLTIDERGGASWTFDAPNSSGPLHFTLENASVRFFDARNGQSLSFGGANLQADISADGELSVEGTAHINGRLARLEAYVKSIARIHGDGTPFDLSFAAPDLAATFTGRLATAKVLSLAGTVSLTAPDLAAAARWSGIKVDDDRGIGNLVVSGALEGAGRVFAVAAGSIAIGGTTAKGDVALDFRKDVPKLQAVLAAPALDLAAFLPGSGATANEWGGKPLGFASLRSLDAALTLGVRSLTYGDLKAGPARIAATLETGLLSAAVSFGGSADARADVKVIIDGAASPPQFSLNVRGLGIDAARLFPALFNVSWLSGSGNLALALSGRGQTQQEIIGTLQGWAEVSFRDGAVPGVDIAATLGNVSQRIVEGWAAEAKAQTAFSSFAARITAADGIANVTGLTLASPSLAMTGTGEIDLLRRALDLKVDPRLVTGANRETAGLPVSVIVSGPWDRPRIYPDVHDILANPAAAFAALKAMGLVQAVPAPADN